MKYNKLPGTEVEVSAIAMGCWALSGDATWGDQDEKDAAEGVQAALDAGINFFDTAEMYGRGESERLLGKGLAGRRHEAVVASKFDPEHSAPGDLAAACHRSLAFLGTDYIDLYQVHWPSRTVPFEDTWAALEKLREQGKIRHFGVSNFGAGNLEALVKVGRPATDQLPYNLLTRQIEFEILPRCRAKGIGVLCYSPLQLGLLTGKFRSVADVPPGRTRTRHFSGAREQSRHGEPGCEAELFAALDKIRQIARECDVGMSDVAIGWLLHQPGVTGVLAGIRNPEQARRNAAAAEVALSDDVLAALAEATEPVKQALGSNPDMWQTAAESRYR